MLIVKSGASLPEYEEGGRFGPQNELKGKETVGAKRRKKTPTMTKIAVIRFPESARMALKVAAAKEGRSMESAILEAFQYWSARKAGREPKGRVIDPAEALLRGIMQSGDQTKITAVNAMLAALSIET